MHLALLSQRDHARDLAPFDDRRGEQHAADAGRDHRLRLGHRGDADAERAGGDLTPGDLRALVRLGVRPKAAAGRLGMLRHRPQVGFEPVQIDQQGRRGQVGLGSAAIFFAKRRTIGGLRRRGARETSAHARRQELAPVHRGRPKELVNIAIRQKCSTQPAAPGRPATGRRGAGTSAASSVIDTRRCQAARDQDEVDPERHRVGQQRVATAG